MRACIYSHDINCSCPIYISDQSTIDAVSSHETEVTKIHTCYWLRESYREFYAGKIRWIRIDAGNGNNRGCIYICY